MLIISLSKISKAFIKNLDKTTYNTYSPNSKADFSSYSQITKCYDVIFLGCKPQHIQNVAENLPKTAYHENTIFISVLAGTKVYTIQKLFNIKKVFRAMPSLAFEFGNSFIASYCENLTENETKKMKTLFLPNNIIDCKNEEDINNFTAIYASGIGFVFEIMQSFYNACSENFGVDRNELIVNLFENSALFMKEKKISFPQAIEEIASKGGTTQAGLDFLRLNNQLNVLIKNTIDKSVKRAEELSS